MSFDIANKDTWPHVMNADEVAAIFRLPSAEALKKACQLNRFTPAPFQKYPYRFRRADVVRVLEGGRHVDLRHSA